MLVALNDLSSEFHHGKRNREAVPSETQRLGKLSCSPDWLSVASRGGWRSGSPPMSHRPAPRPLDLLCAMKLVIVTVDDDATSYDHILLPYPACPHTTDTTLASRVRPPQFMPPAVWCGGSSGAKLFVQSTFQRLSARALARLSAFLSLAVSRARSWLVICLEHPTAIRGTYVHTIQYTQKPPQGSG